MFAAIYMLHTNPEVYPDPFAFKPERFLDGGPETYSWIPFGGGTRRCIGAAFAELELRIVLREVATVVSSPRCRPLRRRIAHDQTDGPNDEAVDAVTTVVVLVGRGSAQAEERQDRHDDHDEPDEIDDCIHVTCLRGRKRRSVNGTFLPRFRSRARHLATSVCLGR